MLRFPQNRSRKNIPPRGLLRKTGSEQSVPNNRTEHSKKSDKVRRSFSGILRELFCVRKRESTSNATARRSTEKKSCPLIFGNAKNPRAQPLWKALRHSCQMGNGTRRTKRSCSSRKHSDTTVSAPVHVTTQPQREPQRVVPTQATSSTRFARARMSSAARTRMP